MITAPAADPPPRGAVNLEGIWYAENMEIPFQRMQGLGNSFIVFKGPLALTSDEVIRYCHMYSDDGVLVVTPIDKDSVEMQYWNADGSIAEMCGNGLRCVTRFAVDNGMVKPGTFTVVTGAGPLKVEWDGMDPNYIEVQVGKATVNPKPLDLYGEVFYEGNVGNPHAIAFVENIKSAPVKTLGPKVETDEHFPNRTNVEFVSIEDAHTIHVRTWERGVGETQACGTGMVAAANAAATIKEAEFPLTVHVLGGNAKVWLDDEGYTRMTGPAQKILDDSLTKKAYAHLLTLGKLTVDFSEVTRAPRYPDGHRESDVEHSFNLALSATELATILAPQLDTGLIAQFSLVHDLPEVHTGDVWTFNATDKELADKKAAEAVALKRLMKELPPHTAQLLKRYEEQVEPEARFVRFIDKLVPAIINMLNEDANSFKEDYGVTSAEAVLEKRAGHMDRLHKMFPEFAEFDPLVMHVWEASAERIFRKV